LQLSDNGKFVQVLEAVGYMGGGGGSREGEGKITSTQKNIST